MERKILHISSSYREETNQYFKKLIYSGKRRNGRVS
jgi:hypothetical protein